MGAICYSLTIRLVGKGPFSDEGWVEFRSIMKIELRIALDSLSPLMGVERFKKRI